MSESRQLQQARDWAVALENETARLNAELAELVSRARRVADSHRNFMDDHSDPGTEALGAQYELVNYLSVLPHGEDLPVNPVESALRIVLALLDEYEEDATPQLIRKVLTDALPRDDKSDRRRRIYLDGKGDAWISACIDDKGVEQIVGVEGAIAEEQSVETIRRLTGSLREIGRTW